MSKPSEFQVKLRAVLESKKIRPTSEPKQIGNTVLTDGELVDLTTDEKLTAIMGLVRGIVPPAYNMDHEPVSGECEYAGGWEECRNSILSSLGDL